MESLMELLLVVGALVALAALAPRFGEDTTERIVSEEELLGRHSNWAASDPGSSGASWLSILFARGMRLVGEGWAVGIQAVRCFGRELALGAHSGDVFWPTLRDYPCTDRGR
jgi:hypothetical protein